MPVIRGHPNRRSGEASGYHRARSGGIGGASRQPRPTGGCIPRGVTCRCCFNIGGSGPRVDGAGQ
jgi:hypothetical protein